jgi:hypothetical protein
MRDGEKTKGDMATKKKTTKELKEKILQNFEVKNIHRSKISYADYNPRTITRGAKKRLEKILQENGLVMPLVWNQRTGNLISGHQRLMIMDERNGLDTEYQVCVLDVDEATERKLNVRLNNVDTMGEFDWDKLKKMSDDFKLDFETDFAFDSDTIDFEIGLDLKAENVKQTEANAVILSQEQAEQIRAERKKIRETQKAENADVETYHYVSIVFDSRAEGYLMHKRLLAKLGIKTTEHIVNFEEIKPLFTQEIQDYITQDMMEADNATTEHS